MQFLGYTKEQLLDKKAYWTALEISHQPEAWIETLSLADAAREKFGEQIDFFYRKQARVLF